MGCCPSKEQEPADQRKPAPKNVAAQPKVTDPKKEPLLQQEHTANGQMPDTTIFDTTNHHSGSSDEKERDVEKAPIKPHNGQGKHETHVQAEPHKVHAQKPVRIEDEPAVEVRTPDIMVSNVIFEAPKPPLESLKPIVEENVPEMENLFTSSIKEPPVVIDTTAHETEPEAEHHSEDHPGRKPDSAPIIYDPVSGITSQGTYYPNPEDQIKFQSMFLPVQQEVVSQEQAPEEQPETVVSEPQVAENFEPTETVLVETQGPAETKEEVAAEIPTSELVEPEVHPGNLADAADVVDEDKHTKPEGEAVDPATIEVSELVAPVQEQEDTTTATATEGQPTLEVSDEVVPEVEEKRPEPVEPVAEVEEKPVEEQGDAPQEAHHSEVPKDVPEEVAQDAPEQVPQDAPEEAPENPPAKQDAPLMADSGIFKSAAELTDSVLEEVVKRDFPAKPPSDDPNHLFMSTVSEMPPEAKAESSASGQITESSVDLATSELVLESSTEPAQGGEDPAPLEDKPAE